MGAIVAASLHVSVTNPQSASQFVQGFQHALLVAAGITLAAALVAVTKCERTRGRRGAGA